MNPLDAALRCLAARDDLSEESTKLAVAQILSGTAPESKVAAFLTGLKVKGETAAELAGAVLAIREAGQTLTLDPRPALLLDTCGTGGDGACTLNISTATAIVVASCGVPIAKHGNRAASGNSGSAEVLAELGITIEADPGHLNQCLAQLGITFLFAPRFHPGLRHAAPIRKQLPFRTLFNLVGPLANPARPTHQLIGVAGDPAADLVAQTIVTLGTERAAVITGHNGLDEVTLDGPTKVRWVEGGQVTIQEWTASDFGLAPVELDQLRVASPNESADRLRAIFAGAADPGRSMVLANSAAALLVAGVVSSLSDGVHLAANALDTQASQTLLERWVKMCGDKH